MADQPVDPNRPTLAQVGPEHSGPTPDKILFYLILALLVLGIGGYFGGRSVWRTVRTQRARAQATLAEKLVREQKVVDAQRAIRAAILMAPNDPQVLRATATWCTLAGLPDGLMYWDRLFAITPPTREDQLKKLDLALLLHRLDISRDLLKTLLQADDRDREILVRTVRHHSQTGQPELAVKAARLAVSRLPSDPQLQFMLGGLLLESSDRNAGQEARQVLWNVALGTSAWRDAAVDMLARTRLLNAGDRLLLIRTIEARTPVSLPDRLRVLDLRLAMATDRDTVWQQTSDLREQYPGLTNQLQLARWLVNNGGTNRALSMLPRAAALTNRAAATVTLEILTQLQGWDEIRSWLQQSPALSPSLIDAAEGLLAVKAGRSSDAPGYFANALQKAGGRPTELVQVAGVAQAAEQPVIAAGALLKAAELNPLLTVQLCRRALALVQPIEDLTVARRILERLGEFLPGEPSVMLERSYFDLLFGENVERARQSVTRLLDHPTVAQDARVVLALANLKRGDTPAGLTDLEGLTVAPEKLAPRMQAVYAAVLLANNQREPAIRLARQIRSDQLRKKELELISPLL